jgi:integrase
MINMAFKHLDIDRLSPFRGLSIRGEGENTRPIPIITDELLLQVKTHLLLWQTPAKMVGLIQLNTGMRISEPAMARLEDLVLDHEIPHLWVKKKISSQIAKQKQVLGRYHYLAYRLMLRKNFTNWRPNQTVSGLFLSMQVKLAARIALEH